MTHFRLRWRKLGGHVHVSVWSSTARDLTHGRNGTLVFREDEWEDFTTLLTTGRGLGLSMLDSFEFINEESEEVTHP